MQGALSAGCGCDVVAKVKLKDRNGRPMVNSLKRDLARQPRTSTSKGEGKSKLGQDQDTITGPRKGTGTVRGVLERL
jgi:hypothetical protein